MSETEYILFQRIIAIIETIVYGDCLSFFFYPFMTYKGESRSDKIRKTLIVFMVYILIYLIGDFVPLFGWFLMAVVIVFLMTANKYFGINKEFIILLCILFLCIRDMSRLIIESIHYVLCRKYTEGMTGLNSIYYKGNIINFLTVMFQFILFIFLLCLVKHKLKINHKEVHVKELCYLILIPIINVLFVNVIFRVVIVTGENMIFQLYEQYPIFLIVIPFIEVLFFFGIIGAVMIYGKTEKLQEERKKYFVEECQMTAIKKRMEEVKEFYNGICQMKHEMRNHLTNIKGLAASENYEDMEKYLARLDESINSFEITAKTGNAVTDVIINDKQKAAGRLGIRFRSEFSYPVSDKYDAYDIGIIINNLLQNALEACERMKTGEKYITLSGKQKRKFFLIEVRNSFDGEIEFDNNTRLPVSRKEKDRSLHGIGLSNVKREVEKYMGDIDIKVDKNMFCAAVLLQERSSNE